MTPTSPSVPDRIAVVGRGRLGPALADALRPFAEVSLHGRGATGTEADLVLLCVPDHQIAAAAALIAPGRLVGHCSGATGLDPLAPHEALGLHPLMTVSAAGASFAGAGAAIGGSTPRARGVAAALAQVLGLRAVPLEDADRPAYHAAASVASNFLITLEAWAEELLPCDRALLAPLVRASVESWATQGPERALTGPIARADEATVARQRAVVAARTPERLALWDELTTATEALAARSRASAPLPPAPAGAAR
ncbi:MAG: DUF2520 domain-containing protein [Solirubrobacterales bacterium]|nr:DUF2520 domain-containing protein [Solirubrobacterales bacterium]